MRRRYRVLVLSVLALAVIGQTEPDENADRRAKVLNLTNAERARDSLPELKSDSRLDQAAQRHAEDMAKRGYFDHKSPEGVDPGTRIQGAGFRASAWGENIFMGPVSAKEAVDGWMKSPGHRANILGKDFTHMGLGYARNPKGRTYWVQVFGRPRA